MEILASMFEVKRKVGKAAPQNIAVSSEGACSTMDLVILAVKEHFPRRLGRPHVRPPDQVLGDLKNFSISPTYGAQGGIKILS